MKRVGTLIITNWYDEILLTLKEDERPIVDAVQKVCFLRQKAPFEIESRFAQGYFHLVRSQIYRLLLFLVRQYEA